MSEENKPSAAARAYGAGVRATNKASLIPWILFVLMLVSWFAGR
ncbi:MAG: hypothetical protein FD131_4215 [Rhodocyclaceae bacterium]|nr:MAG: hypothetical protein FD131_4215 [Rhodocyclaceae bacterium]